MKTQCIFIIAVILAGCTSGRDRAMLTHEQAVIISSQLANDKAEELYQQDPFTDCQQAHCVRGRGVWVVQWESVHDDIRATVVLALDGATNRVEIISGHKKQENKQLPATILPPTEEWNSLPRLEAIAKAYAKHQVIDFDFIGTHAESRVESWQTNIAIIDFFHGMNQPVFEARIDRSGKVIETSIPTLAPTPTQN